MRAQILAIAIGSCLLATPRQAQAQCSTIVDSGQKNACEQALIEFQKELRENKYITETTLKTKDLEIKGYVTNKVGNETYVTNDALRSEDYVSRRELDPYAKSTTGDYFWILQAAVLVLLMQAGFLFLELGVVRRQFDKLQATYKVTALFMTYAGYVPIGFALMYGTSSLWGFWGTYGFPESVISTANEAISSGTTLEHFRSIGFFLFQAAFAATAVTIASGSIAERMSVKGFALASFFMAALIYPVFGHWAWSGGIYPDDNVIATIVNSSNPVSTKVIESPPEKSSDRKAPINSAPGKSLDLAQTAPVGSPPGNPSDQDVLKAQIEKFKADLSAASSVGWLQRNGFHDFAGSTVVHSVGGWFALVGALVLGPRTGRFGKKRRSFVSRSMGMATAGALFLFFGWFGFNGGSTLAYSTKVDDIVFATVIAGFAAGLSATALALLGESRQWKQKGYVLEKALGGFLGGLVAITASCDLVTELWQPVVIGLTAGVVHNLVFDLLLRRKIDDPVGAVPVHLGCGVWGTGCVVILNHQFLAQAVGIVAAFAWTFVTASLVFGLLMIPKKLNIGEWLFLSEFEKQLLVRPQIED